MSVDLRTARDGGRAAPERLAALPGTPEHPPGPARTALSEDSLLAVEIRGLMERGDMGAARERFDALVAWHQRRASRIAYHYLRDADEADEAVQDAFVKVFTHLGSYREIWPFEVWFTRILVNGCLDRRNALARRRRWFAPGELTAAAEARAAAAAPPEGNPEERLLGRERRNRLAGAIDRLNGRQRTVFVLCHFGDCTPREISAMTGLAESTVRVHLFRAAHKLRGFLGGRP